MRFRGVLLLLFFLSPIARAQQTFDIVVSGYDVFGSCYIIPIAQPVVEWYNPARLDYDLDVAQIASDGSRVLAVMNESPLRIVELRPDGSQVSFYQGSPASYGMRIAVATGGRVFVSTGGPTQSLVRISAAGVLEATYPLATDNIDVGPDGCTIYYRTGANAIARINGCTGAALPDYAGPFPWLSDFEVLPDGQVLVMWESRVHLYDASGAFVRTVADLATYGLSDRYAATAAVRNGAVYIAAVDGCNSSESVLLAVALANGDELSRRPIQMTSAMSIVLADASTPTVPTLSEMALALLAFVLAAGGALVLKLR